MNGGSIARRASKDVNGGANGEACARTDEAIEHHDETSRGLARGDCSVHEPRHRAEKKAPSGVSVQTEELTPNHIAPRLALRPPSRRHGREARESILRGSGVLSRALRQRRAGDAEQQ
jgi:hypothetical protein